MRCRVFLVLALLTASAGASAAAGQPAPTPTPRLLGRVETPGPRPSGPVPYVEPTKPPSLRDFAQKRREQPAEERKAGTFSARFESMLQFQDLRVLRGQSNFRVQAVVRNAAPQRLYAVFQLAGRKRDGSVATRTLRLDGDQILRPGEQALLDGELPLDVDPETIVIGTLEAREPAGTIELSADRSRRAAIRSCLVYGHRLPFPAGQRNYSIEITVKNGCAETVQPEDLGFEVSIRDATGVFRGRKMDFFADPVPAGGSARRSLIVEVPADATVTVEPSGLPR